MARPREFDLNEAVEKAMRLFWSLGYQKATMSDLERAMNIGRGSVYAAFPDKQTLFLRALERYREAYTLPCLSILDADRQPMAALGEMFDCLAARYTDPETPPGCLVVVNTGHLSPKDAPQATEALAASVMHGETQIAKTLKQAANAGDLRDDAPAVEILARFLAATTQGMATMARLGRSEAQVRDVGRVALMPLRRH